MSHEGSRRDSAIALIDEVFDIIIVGAGPAGLAVAARLHEPVPAAIFTDEEHRRYQWLQAYGSGVAVKHYRSGQTKRSAHAARRSYRMAVLDATADAWIERWRRRFYTLDISHLRSPLPWHLDPKDADSLLAYAHQQKRESELFELKGCVGKELSKHARKQRQSGRHKDHGPNHNIEINEREKNDYYAASRELFEAHCLFVQNDYGLRNGLVCRATVSDITFDQHPGSEDRIFTVDTGKCRRYARAVVLALGPNSEPTFPDVRIEPSPDMSPREHPQMCHSAHAKIIPDVIVQQRIARQMHTAILVVGGGLTSAQISDLAIRKGVGMVYHIMRGPCKVKHFDVDLPWMSKYRNPRLAQFWSADADEERMDLLTAARNGGSMTPTYHKKILKHKASGKLSLHTYMTLTRAKFLPPDSAVDHGGHWEIETDPPLPDLPRIDYIYFATGMRPDVQSFPCLKTMSKQYPIKQVAGLPCLNSRLMWNDDVPLFVIGALAGLRIGPAAGNLGGVRLAAERIALEIEKMRLGVAEAEIQPVEEKEDLVLEYALGYGSKFSCLERV